MELPKINIEKQKIRKSIINLKCELYKTMNSYSEQDELGNSFHVINMALVEILKEMTEASTNQLLQENDNK